MLLGGCQSLTQQSAPVVQGSQPRIGALPPTVRPMPSGSSVSPDSSGESSNGGNSSVVAYKPRAKVQVVTEASPPPSSRSAPTVMVSAPPPSTPRLATTVRDPDDDRPESYKVKAGDTLYSIALNNGQDYREIAAWNQLEDPSIIKVDQVLRLTPPAGFVASAPVASSPAPVASKNAAASKESPPPRSPPCYGCRPVPRTGWRHDLSLQPFPLVFLGECRDFLAEKHQLDAQLLQPVEQ